MTNDTPAHSGLSRFAPGLAMLREYRKEWLRDGIAAAYPQVQRMLESSRALEPLGSDSVTRSLRAAVETHQD